MRPLWGNAAGSFAKIANVPAGSELWYDESAVAFLREDQKDAAEIQKLQAATIRQLVDAGFDPESIKTAVVASDWSALKHMGLWSVQLQPPGTGQPMRFLVVRGDGLVYKSFKSVDEARALVEQLNGVSPNDG